MNIFWIISEKNLKIAATNLSFINKYFWHEYQISGLEFVNSVQSIYNSVQDV